MNIGSYNKSINGYSYICPFYKCKRRNTIRSTIKYYIPDNLPFNRYLYIIFYEFLMNRNAVEIIEDLRNQY